MLKSRKVEKLCFAAQDPFWNIVTQLQNMAQQGQD